MKTNFNAWRLNKKTFNLPSVAGIMKLLKPNCEHIEKDDRIFWKRNLDCTSIPVRIYASIM
jgi:hypothetical protein